jgi:hypothetical protein
MATVDDGYYCQGDYKNALEAQEASVKPAIEIGDEDPDQDADNHEAG